MEGKETAISTRATSVDFGRSGESSKASSPTHAFEHGAPEVVATNDEQGRDVAANDGDKKLTWKDKLRFFKTKEFWLILCLGQILAICITGTNTLTTFLVIEGTNIPAFQSFFTYVTLNIMYTGYTIYKYGLKKWGRLLLKDGWKCKIFILLV